MKFIRKPLQIEAELWDGKSEKVLSKIKEKRNPKVLDDGSLEIAHDDFTALVKPGDYVIISDDGNHYACEAEQMEKLFEKVED